MPHRIHPLAQYLIVLAIMIGAYSAYAKFAAPMIRGPANAIRRRAAVEPPTLVENRDNKTRLIRLLPPRAWELGKCKTLFTSQGTLLFQEITRVDDEGSYTLKPFTMIINDHESGTAFAEKLDKTEPPIALRAASATLKFDSPLALTGDSKPQMQSAWLGGRVTIFRPSPSAEKDETLKFAAQNVQVNSQRIYARGEVTFAYGPHGGFGNNLSIELTHDAGTTPVSRDFSSIAGVSNIELAKLDHLLIDPRAVQRKPQPSELNSQNSLFSGNDAPLRITCKGPFLFNYQQRMASFEKEVYAEQQSASRDNLSCEKLIVTFESPLEIDESSNLPSVTGTTLKSLRAIGDRATNRPATIIASSQQTNIIGDELQFDVSTNSVIASSIDAVEIINPEINVKAKSILYRFNPDDSLGSLEAKGPGEFLHRSADQQKTVFTQWQNQLSTMDHQDGQKLVVIDGGATVIVDQETQVQSEKLSLTLYEKQQTKIAKDGSTSQVFSYFPAKVFADQKVTVDSANFSGFTNRLVVRWPEPVIADTLTAPAAPWPPATPDASSSDQAMLNHWRSTPGRHLTLRPVQRSFQTDPISDVIPAPTAAQLPAADTKPAASKPVVPQPSRQRGLKQFVHFSADSVEMDLDGTNDDPQLIDLQVDGNVKIQQFPNKTSSQSSTEKPLVITGNRFRVVPQDTDLYRMLVAGTADEPARINAKGIQIVGRTIHVDQQANKAWIEGEGAMMIRQSELDRTSKSATNPPALTSTNNFNPITFTAGDQPNEQPTDGKNRLSSFKLPTGDINVDFAGGMVFDGSKIYFERNVRMATRSAPKAATPSISKTLSQALSIALSSRVDFRNLSGEKRIGDVDLRELVLVNRLNESQRVFAIPESASDDPRLNAIDAPVIFQNETYSAAGLLTDRQHVVVPQVTVNAETKTIFASGPGKIITHQTGSVSTDSFKNLGRARNTAPTSSQNDPSISFLQVNFEDRLVANIPEKQMLVKGKTRTVFCPKRDFQFALDPDDVAQTPADAVKMVCEQMELNQWRPSGAAKSQNEFHGSGNVNITGPNFQSVSDRVSYNDGNDQLIIEGTRRSPAVMRYRSSPASNSQQFTATKIAYSPRTGTAEVLDSQGGNLSN